MCVALTGVKGVTASRDRWGGRGWEGERRMPEGIITGKREREFKGGTHKSKPKKGGILSVHTTARKKCGPLPILFFYTLVSYCNRTVKYITGVVDP